MRWLHLTDIHMGRPGPTEQNVALVELLRALPAVLERHPVDAVLMTGDLAYSGDAAQYAELARTVLVPLRAMSECAEAQFIAVPGNHDLFHDEGSLPVTWDNLGSKRQSKFFEESLDGLRTRAMRATPFANYAAFIDANAIASPDPRREVSRSFTLTVRSRSVCFIATNTAWFSDKDTSDEHKAPYPDVSLRSVLQNASPTEHVFVLGHHPVDWFLPHTRNQFYQLLNSYKAVYLHGHLHEFRTRFDAHGLVTIGFGATYQAPLTGPPTPVYRNTFCLCELEPEFLHIAPYDWDAENGRWVAASSLPPDVQDRSSVLRDGWALPLRRQAASPVLGLGIRALPRNTPSKLNYLGTLDHADWLALIERLQLLDRSVLYDSRRVERGTRSGRLVFRFCSEGGTNYVECVGAPGHSISVAEIQDLNTQLDIEGYLSYAIISLGMFAEDAHALYIRLKEHKPIMICTGGDLAQRMSQLPAFASTLRNLDSSVSDCDYTITSGGRILLIVRDRVGAGSFYVTDAHGNHLEPTDLQVVGLRTHRADLAKVPYRSVAGNAVAQDRPLFDRASYLAACHRAFNNVRYAPLAAIGFRLPDISLDDLYIQTRAILGQAHASLLTVLRFPDEMVRDTRLDGPFANYLHEQVARKLELTSGAHDSAPRFYQQYGAITVLGDPGSGKTFFVQHEILTYTDPHAPSWYKHHTPLFVPLAELATRFDPQIGILGVAAQIAETQGLPIREADIADLLNKGLLAFFLDGLDEIVSVELRARILDTLCGLIDIALPLGNRFILTSRPAAVHRLELPHGLEVISMKGMSHEDIRVLASKLLTTRITETSNSPTATRNAADIVDALLDDVDKTPGIASLAQNPLFFTLLVMIYANTGVASARRHRLYQQAVQTLVAVRTRQAGQRGLSEADLRVRLGGAAFEIYSDPRGLLLTKGQLAVLVARIIARERGSSVHAGEASRWLQDVAESTGLLVFHAHHHEDSLSLVTFMHHSFLEFYAAHGLLAADNRACLPQVARLPRWRPVLTLAGGILGESGDVYPLVDLVLNTEERGDSLTLRSTILAFDCILENEIPPERVISALLSRLDERIRTGPLRLDGTLRGEVGHRLGRLLMSSGSPLITRFLAIGLSDSAEDIKVAYLDLTGYVGVHARLSPQIVDAATHVATSSAPAIQHAMCNAVAHAIELQTPTLLDKVVAALAGNAHVRLKALETMIALPTLALRTWDQLARIVMQDRLPHAAIAANAILRAGFKIDTSDSEFAHLILEALRRVIDAAQELEPSECAIRCTTTEIAALITSPSHNSRLLGLRLTFWVSDDDFVYRSVMDVLRNPRTSHDEMAVALAGFRFNRHAHKLIKRTDSELLCALLANSHRDVRTRAAALIGELSHSDAMRAEFETSALVGYARAKRGTEEYMPAIDALAKRSVISASARLFLLTECERLLQKSRLEPDETIELRRLLQRLNIFDGDAPDSLIRRLKTQARNHQLEAEIRDLVLQAIAMLAPVDDTTTEWIIHTMANPSVGTTSQIPFSVSLFVKRCRRRLDYLLDVQAHLPKLQDAILDYYARFISVSPERAEDVVYHLRNSLEVVQHMMNSYEELAQRLRGPSPG